MHPKLTMDSIVRGISTLQDRALQEAGLDLTAQQATVAILLFELGEQAVHQLTSLLEINQSAVTRLVDRLEERGLAERSNRRGDGRVVNVQLTTKGRAEAAVAREAIEGLKDALLTGVAPDDLDVFWKVLRQMRATVAERVLTTSRA
jgi:DNA-binding MarR family transcriptional regulator